MKLTDRQIKNTKPKEKPYKLTDGGGLYLLVSTSGGKLWRFKYRINGKEKTLSIGQYPSVALIAARAAAENARTMLASGQDPAAAKQEQKAAAKRAAKNTLSALFAGWHKDNLARWKPNHAEYIKKVFHDDIFPKIGHLPIDKINVSKIKDVTDRIAERGAPSIAEKSRQWLASIYKYAAMLEITDRNPAAVIPSYLQNTQSQHMAALPKEELTEFYTRLFLLDIAPSNRIAVLLTMVTFLRSNELRGGRWGEIDMAAKVWTIPAERMKMKRSHRVPLSDWAIQLLQELYQYTGNTPYLFPNRNRVGAYISENTLIKIVHQAEHKTPATPHGFRSLASGVLNEHGFNPDAIERQLAHKESNKIRAAYNRADYWPHRVEFMQWYSDFLRERYQKAMEQIKQNGS